MVKEEDVEKLREEMKKCICWRLGDLLGMVSLDAITATVVPGKLTEPEMTDLSSALYRKFVEACEKVFEVK